MSRKHSAYSESRKPIAISAVYASGWSALGPKMVVLTDGSKGAYLFCKEDQSSDTSCILCRSILIQNRLMSARVPAMRSLRHSSPPCHLVRRRSRHWLGRLSIHVRRPIYRRTRRPFHPTKTGRMSRKSAESYKAREL